jgi:hypothetical protein
MKALLVSALSAAALVVPVAAQASGCAAPPVYAFSKGEPIHLQNLLALKPQFKATLNTVEDDTTGRPATKRASEALHASSFSAARDPANPNQFALIIRLTPSNPGVAENSLSLRFTPQPPKFWTTVYRAPPATSVAGPAAAGANYARDYLISGDLSVVSDPATLLGSAFKAKAQLALYGEGQACFDGIYAFMLNIASTPRTPSFAAQGVIVQGLQK